MRDRVRNDRVVYGMHVTHQIYSAHQLTRILYELYIVGSLCLGPWPKILSFFLLSIAEKNCGIHFCNFVLKQTFRSINFMMCVLVLCVFIVISTNMWNKCLRIQPIMKNANINLRKFPAIRYIGNIYHP